MKNEKIKNVLIYQAPNGAIEFRGDYEEETIWGTQRQIAEVFGVDVRTINEHLINIYNTGELKESSTLRKFRIVQKEGSRDVAREVNFYNLDAILSVGYRVNSKQATKFRIWATARLKEYLIKGFTMDDERLKKLGGGNYWKELLDRIRDIRSSEKVLYRQVLDLYATSIDYDPNSKESVQFFKIVQNKLHYAAHGHTAAEVIAKRADAGQPFMGLLTFSGGEVTRKDIGIAKNYLTENELKKLNNIVSAYFDLAEVKAMNHEPMRMNDWITQLDRLIRTFDGKLLDSAGSVSHEQALKKAETEYKKYQSAAVTAVERAYLETLEKVEKKVKKSRKSTGSDLKEGSR